MGAGQHRHPNKVRILVWSEFSRRIPQNDNGTDHGSQGPMFVVGGTVNGGVYGTHPNIDPTRSTTTRNSRYWQARIGTAGSTAPPTSATSTAPSSRGGSTCRRRPCCRRPRARRRPRNDYWTAANFNVGFLPNGLLLRRSAPRARPDRAPDADRDERRVRRLLAARRGWRGRRRSRCSTPVSRSTGPAAPALARRTATWPSPRLRHVAVCGRPHGRPPYSQLLNTSAWTLWASDLDAERANPEWARVPARAWRSHGRDRRR
jgi:hypothetical protein